jgi:hypothetical protein
MPGPFRSECRRSRKEVDLDSTGEFPVKRLNGFDRELAETLEEEVVGDLENVGVDLIWAGVARVFVREVGDMTNRREGRLACARGTIFQPSRTISGIDVPDDHI